MQVTIETNQAKHVEKWVLTLTVINLLSESAAIYSVSPTLFPRCKCAECVHAQPIYLELQKLLQCFTVKVFHIHL